MRRYTMQVDQQAFEIEVQEVGANQFYVRVDGQEYEVAILAGSDLAEAVITPQISPASTAAPGRAYRPPVIESFDPLPHMPQPPQPPRPDLDGVGIHTRLSAPMPGTILKIAVQPGEAVERGQTLVILEAMKMKNVLKAPVNAVIKAVLVTEGQVVNFGETILQFE